MANVVQFLKVDLHYIQVSFVMLSKSFAMRFPLVRYKLLQFILPGENRFRVAQPRNVVPRIAPQRVAALFLRTLRKIVAPGAVCIVKVSHSLY